MRRVLSSPRVLIGPEGVQAAGRPPAWRPLLVPETLLVILFHDRARSRQDSLPSPVPPGFFSPGVKHLSGITFQLHDATGQRKYPVSRFSLRPPTTASWKRRRADARLARTNQMKGP